MEEYAAYILDESEKMYEMPEEQFVKVYAAIKILHEAAEGHAITKITEKWIERGSYRMDVIDGKIKDGKFTKYLCLLTDLTDGSIRKENKQCKNYDAAARQIRLWLLHFHRLHFHRDADGDHIHYYGKNSLGENKAIIVLRPMMECEEELSES